MIPNEPHDEFLELCALSASGELNSEDQRRLREHLAGCPACREARQQYESIVSQALPAIASDEVVAAEAPGSWSQAEAERLLFERLAQEEKHQASAAKQEKKTARASQPSGSHSAIWRHIWMLYAAGLLLFLTVGLSVYWIGLRRGADSSAHLSSSSSAKGRQSPSSAVASLEEQLSDAAHDREVTRGRIAQRDRELAELGRQLQRQNAEIVRMKSAQERLEADRRNNQASVQDLTRERTVLTEKLDAAQTHSQGLESQLQILGTASSRDAGQMKTLEAEVGTLSQQLKDRDAAVSRQSELLAHDRDIRELMGARDLYIAEVYDVADNGATKKPYGRVFFTRGKSLIFYAYDLDEAAVKNASTFQAWGRRGPDRQQALNLGIFYEDNTAKKRWVLKLDDPKMLAEIDAVFVTVEPKGRSAKPSGKPLLFAYLKVDPNHP